MKTSYRIFLFALTLSLSSTTAPHKAPKKQVVDYKLLQELTHKYTLPKEMAEIIEKNNRKIEKHFVKFPPQPLIFKEAGFVVKDVGIERLINAERMRQCIEENNFNYLDVAKKYIYKFNNRWITVAEYIEFDSALLGACRQEAEQLYQLGILTGYGDWGLTRRINYPNWVRNKKTGKLTCIDTEDKSFTGSSLLPQISTKHFSKQACAWAEQQLAQNKKSK